MCRGGSGHGDGVAAERRRALPTLNWHATAK